MKSEEQSSIKSRIYLLLAFIVMFVFPGLGSYVKWKGQIPGYGDFPAQNVENYGVEVPGFSPLYFALASMVALFILTFLIFPQLFGFKLPSKQPPVQTAGYPKWFWWGLAVTIISWILMWSEWEVLYPIDKFTFVPLWWGFIFVLDGMVYNRNGKISLISTRGNFMILIAVVSCGSWYVFEYLNFFVCENWYYPNNKELTNFGYIFWYMLSYTTVLPAIFEWYCWIKTFPRLRDRYSQGPSISLSKRMMMMTFIFGLFFSFFMGYYPFILFWGLWIMPVPVLAAIMGYLGYWTPFSPIAKGNWSPIILIGLATVLNGLFWEFWNFGSEWFKDFAPENPNFWKYSIPYLDKFHIFSEMPVLGYFGYLFFGNICWVIWLVAAYLCGFDRNFDIKYVNEKK